MKILVFRAHNNEKLPFWYRWYLHLIINFILFAGLFFILIPYIKTDTSTLPLLLFFLIIWSILEYFIHRFVLHGKSFSKMHFQQQHSVYHHSYFTVEEMNWQKPIDLNRVFLMPWDLLAVLVVNAVIAFFLTTIINQEMGFLFFYAGLIYFMIYEILHGLCHTSRAENIPFLSKLIRHHQQHHDKTSMEEKNFSVTSPWLDSFFGSKSDV